MLKSKIATRPSSLTRTLAGVMFRWTIPARWTPFSPDKTAARASTIRCGAKGGGGLRASPRLRPFRAPITR